MKATFKIILFSRVTADGKRPVMFRVTHARKSKHFTLSRYCLPGEWVLVFLGSARERLSPERAAEVRSLLALVEDTLAGRYDPQSPQAQAAFALPSAMGAEQLAALLGAGADLSSQGSSHEH